MAIYDTRYGLNQPVVDYLNQGLPPPLQNTYTPLINNTVAPGVTEEQLVALYPQIKQGTPFKNPYMIDPDTPSTDFRTYRNPFKYDSMDEVGPDYGYIDSPKEGLPSLKDVASKYLNNNLLKTGLDGLGSFLENILPIDPNAARSNELVGSGIKVDRTGRIVTDNYRTPEGIMAGYNVNAVDGNLGEKAGEKIETMRNTLQRKYNLDKDSIDKILSEIEETGEYTGDLGYNEKFGKTSNLFQDILNLKQFQKIYKKSDNVGNLLTDEKYRKRKKFQEVQKRKDKRRIKRAYEEDTGTGPGSYTKSGGSGIQKDSKGNEVGYNDPFDPGGGE